MSQPYNPQQPYPGPTPPPPAPKRKRFGFLALGVAVAATFAVGSCTGALGASAGKATTAVPGSTVTVTAPAPTVTVTEGATPAEKPKATEAPEPEKTVEPSAEDWKITIKVLKKTCFGSAGCNVQYRIKPEFVGDRSSYPDSGTVEITYEVNTEDGPAVNTFEVDLSSDKATFPEKEFGQTSSENTKLKGKITDVYVREW